MALALDPDARRFTVAEFHRMGEAGLFGDERVELVGGVVFRMAPIGPVHASLVERLADALRVALGRRTQVRVQNPILLGDDAEPVPDIAVVVGRADYYAAGHPTPADVLLVVEVSDSSAARDRAVKVPRYAAAGIPEVWLVDPSGGVCTLRDPEGDRYTSEESRMPPVTLRHVPDIEVDWSC